MWIGLTILFFLISIFTSLLVYYSLRRITQYEELILEIQQVIKFSTEKMKLVDSKGHYESDDETGFFFEQLKQIQLSLDGIFEEETQDFKKEIKKKEKYILDKRFKIFKLLNIIQLKVVVKKYNLWKTNTFFFDKLAENIINTFKFTYFDDPFVDVKHEVVDFMVMNIFKYDHTKGSKEFSYFSVVKKLFNSS